MVTSARRGFYLVISCLGLALGLWEIHSQWNLAGLPRGFDPRGLPYPVTVGAARVGSPDQLRFEVQARPIGSTVKVETSRGPATIRLWRQMRPIELTTSLIAGLLFFAVNLFVFLGRIDRAPARDFYWATLFFGLAVLTGDASPPRREPLLHSGLPIGRMVSLAVLPAFFIHMTLTFPRRRPFIDRARWFMPAVTATAVLVVISQAATFFHYASVRNIAAWRSMGPPWVLARMFLVGVVGAGCILLIDSSRRLELTRERESTKWLLWGFAIGITPYVFLRVLPRIFGLESPIGNEFDRIFELSIPFSFTFAVVRYRFLDIDIIIRRSIIYTVLAGVMGAVYIFLAVLVGRVVHDLVPAAARLIPFVAAIVTVALYGPTRRAIGGWVDRTFFKIDYDHAQTLRSLKERSPSVSSPLGMAGIVRSLLDESLQPKIVAVLIPAGPEHHAAGEIDPTLARKAIALAEPLLNLAGRPIVAPNSTSLPEIENPDFPAALRDAGLRILVPLAVEGRALGWALLGERRSERRYVEQDLKLIEGIAEEAAVALERIRLVQQVAEEAIARQRLDEIDHLKSDFLARASHDLRTPITSITWSVQNLLDGVVGQISDRQREYLETVRTSAGLLARLVNNLVEISRLELSRGRIEIEPVDLPSAVAETLASLKPVATQREVRFKCDVATELPSVRGNRDKLLEILANLIENALRYSPNGGEIEITVDRGAGPRRRFSVRDHGPGIAAGEEEIIFERFKQGQPSPYVQMGGFGLGLYVVRQFVELMGGAVSVVNHPDGGAVFTCVLLDWDATEVSGG
jgi:signal transduction histidine kinase